MDKLQIRAAIIGGIISAIIVIIFINPLLNFLWDIVNWSGSYFYYGFIDKIYKRAALGHSNYVSVLILMFMLYWFLVIFTLTFISLLMINKGRISGKKLRIVRIVGTLTGNTYFNMLMYLMGIIILILSVVVVFAEVNFKISFNQRLAVLTPKITELERKELLGSWAAMETRNDYDKIVENMQNLAKLHKVSLPELRIK